MNRSAILAAALAATVVLGAGARESVTWQSMGNTRGTEGDSRHIQRFVISAERPFDALAFCIFKNDMRSTDPRDTVVEILPGYYEIKSPRFENAHGGMPVVVDLVTSGALTRAAALPDGIHLAYKGSPRSVDATVRPPLAKKSQWADPSGYDPMIYGPEAFGINDSLRTALRPGPYMQIPTPRHVSVSPERVPMPKEISVRQCDHSGIDYYRLEILPDSTASVATNSAFPAAVKAQAMRRLRLNADADGMVPVATVEGWSDYRYRGFMLDVARNFLPVSDVKRVIDLMADYGLNTLHFHIGDDEGWRLEIPGLPELTAVGARRGYTETDDVPFLKQIYRGTGNPDDKTSTANGFYSVAEYSDILRYAAAKGIDVIPEFDSPGHSRAAIRAMEWRAKTTGDASLRLIHDGDTSRYSTAQFFSDNTMNPALEGPYRFWGKVMDALLAVYHDSGVELKAVNIGGDEVADGCWDGSDAARRLMESEHYTHQRQLHAHFVKRLAALAAERGLKIAGWQEIATGHSADYDAAVQPSVYSVNCWTNAGNTGAEIAEKGYPVVISNVDYLYFDHIHTTHPEDPGMSWGGVVSEFAPFHATVDRLCPADSAVQRNVAGISAHLFSETVNGLTMVERYILPRMLGLAERAAHSHATLADSEYFGAIVAEMPRWVADGRNFYLRQPGIRVVEEGLVEMNEPYGLGDIRYTLDGSLPTRESTLYTAPFAPPANAQVRARLFFGPASSWVTIL